MINNKNSFIANLSLWFILITALLVRIWGIRFGLPLTECRPDEASIVNAALGFFSGDLNPHFFIYPSFFIYIVSVLYGAYWVGGLLLGWSPGACMIMSEAIQYPLPFFLMSRVLAAIMGTLSVYWLYVLAKQLFDKKTALLSMLFLSLAYLHVRDSHFGVTDVPMTFWILGCLLLLVLAYQQNKLRLYLSAGFMAGLAASTKYNALLLLAPMVVIQFLNLHHTRNQATHLLPSTWHKISNLGLFSSGLLLILAGISLAPEFIQNHKFHQLAKLQSSRYLFMLAGSGLITAVFIFTRSKRLTHFLDQRFLGFFTLLIVGFLSTSPFVLLDFKTFARDFLYELTHLSQGHHTILGIGWWYHIRYTLPHGLGWAMVIAALLGTGMMFLRQTKTAWILFAFPITYYIVIGKGYTVFLRYMIPIIPFICLAAAFLVSQAWQYLSHRLPVRLAGGLIICLVAIPLAEPVYNIVQCNRLLGTTDNRLIATDWFIKNIPHGRSVYQTGFYASHLPLNPLSGILMQPSVKSASNSDYTILDFDPKMNVFTDSEGGKSKPEFIIFHEYPLPNINLVLPIIQNLLHTEYCLQKSFIAIQPGHAHFFDLLDAFYLPFTGWNGVERPGPNIYLYEKINPQAISAAGLR